MSKLEEEIISHVMDITFKWERIIQDTHEGFSRFALRERDGREEGRKGGGGSAALCASNSASSPACFRFVL